MLPLCPRPQSCHHLSSFSSWEYFHVRGRLCKPVPTTQVLPCCGRGGPSCDLSASLLGHFVHVPSWCPELLPWAFLANHLLTQCGVLLARNFTIWASRPISRAFCQIIYFARVLFGSPPWWDQRWSLFTSCCLPWTAEELGWSESSCSWATCVACAHSQFPVSRILQRWWSSSEFQSICHCSTVLLCTQCTDGRHHSTATSPATKASSGNL